MRNTFLKILALFFLTILLTSNVLNLHIYIHEQENSHCLVDSCENNEDNKKDTPCQLCLLALNLNNLDYNNTTEFSLKNHTSIIEHNRKEILTYQELNYNQLSLNDNKNKAPPYHI